MASKRKVPWGYRDRLSPWLNKDKPLTYAERITTWESKEARQAIMEHFHRDRPTWNEEEDES